MLMSRDALFRAEVIEHRRRRLMGEVMVVQPLTQTMMAAALTVFSLAGLTYLVAGSYAKTETVLGYIAPVGGLAQIYATHGGVVTEVSVHEGDMVPKGAPLIRLSLETAGTNGVLGEKLQKQTEVRIKEIERQIDAADRHTQDEAQRLKAHIQSIRAELASLDQRMASEAETLKLQQDDVRRYADLQRTGDGTLLELSRRRQLTLAQQATMQALAQQREQRLGDLSDAQAQLSALPTEQSVRLSQLRSAKSELEQSLAQLDVDSSYVVTAPIAGRIASMQAEAGQSVSPQMPLAAIVPEGSGLEANLLVPSRSVGLIQVGQEVRIRIDAFPYQRFGMITGHVEQLSRSSFRPGELVTPLEFREAVYRLTVSLDRSSISAYGEQRPLTPGMTLSADIVTGHRHFIDWVLDPLRAVRRGGYSRQREGEKGKR
jgi:membrane fusion protein